MSAPFTTMSQSMISSAAIPGTDVLPTCDGDDGDTGSGHRFQIQLTQCLEALGPRFVAVDDRDHDPTMRRPYHRPAATTDVP
jgi:hypothetical protein